MCQSKSRSISVMSVGSSVGFFLGAIGISLAFNRCLGLQHLFNELQQMPEHNCANPEQVHGAFRARIIK
jgi:hypothetical protein